MNMASGNVKVDSGYLQIDAETNKIIVNHRLGVVPDFAAIWVDIDNYDLIPADSCVACGYQYMPYVSSGSYGTPIFKFMYGYKHQTSNNLLWGTWQLLNGQYSNEKFEFARGNSPWRVFDTQGNPLHYRWLVGKMNTSTNG